MRKLSPTITLSALLALSWIGLLVSAPRAAEPEVEPGPQQKWEYLETVENPSRFGQDGWEAYAVMAKTPRGSVTYFLKRQLSK